MTVEIMARDSKTGASFPVFVPDDATQEQIKLAVEAKTRKVREAMDAQRPHEQLFRDVGEAAAEPLQPAQGPNPLIPRNVSDVRGPVIGAGATLGGVAGAGLGAAGGGIGAIPGGAAGAALGAAGGSIAFDALVEGGRSLGLVGEEGVLADDPRLGARGGEFGPATRAANEALFESIFPGIGGATAPLRRAALRRFAKLGEEGTTATLGAAREGVGLGIEDVTQRTGTRGVRKVIGIFPVLGTPFHAAKKRQSQQLARAYDDIVDRFGPEIDTPEAGRLILNASKRNFKTFSKRIGKEYDAIFDAARIQGARIPTAPIRDAAEAVVNTRGARRPRITVVDENGLEKTIDMPDLIKTKMDRIGTMLSKLTDDMSIDQWKGLDEQLKEIQSVSQKQGFTLSNMSELRTAMRAARGQIDDPVLAARLVKNDRAFRNLRQLVESPTGERIESAAPNLFELGITGQGRRAPDELFDLAFKERSPQAMAELRRLMGPEKFGRVMRLHFDRAGELALEGASDAQTFNVIKFKRALGLRGKTTGAERALRVALHGSGVSVEDVRQFVNVLEAASSQGNVDVSTFVARRAALGGSRGAIRAVIPGAVATSAFSTGAQTSAAAGIPLALATVIASRKFARFLTNPAALKSATEMMDPSLTLPVRSRALNRFGRIMGVDVRQPLQQSLAPRRQGRALINRGARLGATEGLAGLGLRAEEEPPAANLPVQ